MNTAARFFAPLFLLLFVAASCHTAQKYVESGDYDSAIDLCVRKLRGKPKKKLEYVQGLELAFRKAQARDLATVQQLKAGGRPEHWPRIHNLHLNIRTRQNKIAPLMPLTAKNGHRAKFQFAEIAAMERESREKSAEYLYDAAILRIERAENGDKMAAREAYGMLEDIKKYYPTYRNRENLMAKARDLGTSYVVFEVKNQSGKILPQAFAERLLTMDKQGLDSQWRDYSFEKKPSLHYDYSAVLLVHNLDISPERVQERAYTDEKKIQDGWDYVLDNRGNVLKDSLGDDVKTPKMVIIRADILEVFQSKAARITGSLQVRDLPAGNLLETCEVGTEVLFENYASTFRGDQRALTPDSRSRIGNQPRPFPRDEDMLVQAAERLKPEVKSELRLSRALQ